MSDLRPFCAHCLTRMEVIKTGFEILYGERQLQSGDLYGCEKCGARVVINLSRPTSLKPHRRTNSEEFFLALTPEG